MPGDSQLGNTKSLGVVECSVAWSCCIKPNLPLQDGMGLEWGEEEGGDIFLPIFIPLHSISLEFADSTTLYHTTLHRTILYYTTRQVDEIHSVPYPPYIMSPIKSTISIR